MLRRFQQIPLVLTSLCLPIVASSEEPIIRKSLDSGAPPATPYQISKSLSFGARWEAEFNSETNFDLDSSNPDKLKFIKPIQSYLALSWNPKSPWSGYVNFKLDNTQVITEEGKKEDRSTELVVDKLYATHFNDERNLRTTIGRQRIKNAREWMFDETVDGISLDWRKQKYLTRLAVFRERAFRDDLLSNDENKRVDHAWLQFQVNPDKDSKYNLFYLNQRNKKKDENIHWLGLDLKKEWGDLDYSFNVAGVSGKRDGKDVDGFGFDVGGVYRLNKSPRIYAIAGYAFGSGDKDDEDLGFRQTGLQDNAAKLGGVTRMSYYGEVFDPELSNISIITAGIGMRPTKDTSINLVWHHFRQDKAFDKLRDANLDVEPNGNSRDLGNEVDIVFGYRRDKRFKLEASIGRFKPGDAFSPNSSSVNLAKVELKYNF